MVDNVGELNHRLAELPGQAKKLTELLESLRQLHSDALALQVETEGLEDSLNELQQGYDAALDRAIRSICAKHGAKLESRSGHRATLVKKGLFGSKQWQLLVQKDGTVNIASF